MPRTSYLLNFCTGFAVLVSLQVLTSWLWIPSISSGDDGWSIAWCDSSSSVSRWATLYLWSSTGVATSYFLLKRKLVSAYLWTIFSFVSFWCLVFSFAPLLDRKDSDGKIALLIFFTLMMWSLRRYQSRLIDANRQGEQGGVDSPLAVQ